MRFEWANQPRLLTVAAGVCLIVFVASFCAAFYTTFAIIGALADRADERELRWGERASRKMSRFGELFVADEHKSLRRLYFSAWAFPADVFVRKAGLPSVL
jgi:hypothetical protein